MGQFILHIFNKQESHNLSLKIVLLFQSFLVFNVHRCTWMPKSRLGTGNKATFTVGSTIMIFFSSIYCQETKIYLKLPFKSNFYCYHV